MKVWQREQKKYQAKERERRQARLRKRRALAIFEWMVNPYG